MLPRPYAEIVARQNRKGYGV